MKFVFFTILLAGLVGSGCATNELHTNKAPDEPEQWTEFEFLDLSTNAIELKEVFGLPAGGQAGSFSGNSDRAAEGSFYSEVDERVCIPPKLRFCWWENGKFFDAVVDRDALGVPAKTKPGRTRIRFFYLGGRKWEAGLTNELIHGNK